MLSPIADIVRMRSVLIAASWARVRDRPAGSMPNDATAIEVAAVMTKNPGGGLDRSRGNTAASQRNITVSFIEA